MELEKTIRTALRPEDRVVAVDADTAFGKLRSRIDPEASGSYWELAGDRHLDSFADIRNPQGAARGRTGEHNEAQVIDNPHRLRDPFQDPGQQSFRR